MRHQTKAVNASRGASFVDMPTGSQGLMLADLWSSVSFSPRVIKAIVLVAILVALVLQKNRIVALIDHEIDLISVQGELNHLGSAEVSERLAGLLNTSFMLADLEAIKQEVLSMPWVHQATVSRLWPGQIQVYIVEQVPVSRWNSASYLNAEGEVFTPDVSLDLSLPSLAGPEGISADEKRMMLSTLAGLQELLEIYGYRATSLQLEARGAWAMVLENGIRVELGNVPFEDKIDRLGRVLAQTPQQLVSQIKRMDARYPNGVAVEWNELALAEGH